MALPSHIVAWLSLEARQLRPAPPPNARGFFAPLGGSRLSSAAIARQGEAGDRTGFNAYLLSPAPSTVSKPASRGAARGRYP
jgi:hypothetical protein